MPPKGKKGSKAGSAPAPHQPKTLSVRAREVQQQQQQSRAADADTDEQPQQQPRVVYNLLAYTSLLDACWEERHNSSSSSSSSAAAELCLVQDCSATCPLWRDSFVASIDPELMLPPLHKYLRPDDANSPAEQLLVAFWREHRYRERLQLGYRLIQEHGDVTGAAMLGQDLAPELDCNKDWVSEAARQCVFGSLRCWWQWGVYCGGRPP